MRDSSGTMRGKDMFDKIEPQKKGKGSVGDERYYGTDNETLDHRI